MVAVGLVLVAVWGSIGGTISTMDVVGCMVCPITVDICPDVSIPGLITWDTGDGIGDLLFWAEILISRVDIDIDPTLGILSPVTLCLIMEGLNMAGLIGVTVSGTDTAGPGLLLFDSPV